MLLLHVFRVNRQTNRQICSLISLSHKSRSRSQSQTNMSAILSTSINFYDTKVGLSEDDLVLCFYYIPLQQDRQIDKYVDYKFSLHQFLSHKSRSLKRQFCVVFLLHVVSYSKIDTRQTNMLSINSPVINFHHTKAGLDFSENNNKGTPLSLLIIFSFSKAQKAKGNCVIFTFEMNRI